MRIVCLDTHILIWGLQEQAETNQTNKIEVAKKMLDDLQKQNIKMMIPSVVYAEFLMKIPAELHLLTGNLLQKSYLIPPFDTQAASLFAQIWQSKNDIIQDLKSSENNSKNKIKVDCMIIATALARSADCIISDDNGLHTLAEGYIESKYIESGPEQLSLFNNEIS